jgi:hypothetical protein
VWARFGALRIDFRRGALVVPGREHAAPTHTRLITRPSTLPLPRSLIAVRPEIAASLIVVEGPYGAIAFVRIAFGSRAPVTLTLDTGASRSILRRSLAGRLRLRAQRQRVEQVTLCSVLVSPQAQTGAWSIVRVAHEHEIEPTAALTRQPIALVRLDRHIADGSLGADQLSRFGSVVIDYSGGRLLLGAG